MQLNERSFREWFVIFLGAIAAILVGSTVVDSGATELVFLIVFTFLITWTLWAGDYWWVPMIVTAVMGGSLQFQFHITLTQVGFILSCLGLLPALMLNRPSLFRVQRRPLPWYFYALPLYILIRLGIDMRMEQGGAGTISQVLFRGLWPFVFGWLFYHFGKSSLVNIVIVFVLIGCTLRVVGVFAGFLTHSLIYIPGINYVITTAYGEDFFEVRMVSYNLLIMLLIVYQSWRNVLLRPFTFSLTAISGYVVLMGGSRAVAVMLLILPVSFFLAARRWILVLISMTLAVTIFVTINMFPAALEQLPSSIERGLSGMIIKPKVLEVQDDLEGSTLWHQDLQKEGYRRLTDSVQAFFFGANLKGFNFNAFLNLGQQQEDAMRVTASADVGAYESGLWTVLGTLGLVGYALFTLVAYHFLKETLPYLLRTPVRTIRQGFIFWATFATILWYVMGSFWGGYPEVEIALLVVASALIQDMKAAASQESRHSEVLVSAGQPAFSLAS